MNRVIRTLVAVSLGAVLAVGTSACDNLPEIDPSLLPSNLPSISLPTRTSEAPTAEPTESPTSAQPQPTATVTESATPEESTESATPAPSASAETPGEDAEPFVWWPWLLAAFVTVIIVVILVTATSKRRAWGQRMSKACTEMSWLEDSLVPHVLAQSSTEDASMLWQAARQRVLDNDLELHALVEAAPSDSLRQTATRGLESLRVLTDAVEADVSVREADDAASLRARRAEIDAARTQLRAFVEQWTGK